MVAILALAIGVGTTQAANNLLTVTPSTFSLSCSPFTGPQSQTVVVTPVTASTVTGTGGAGTANTITVSLQSPATVGLTVTAPGAQVLNASTKVAGITYTVTLNPGANGCVGYTGATLNYKFNSQNGTAAAAVDNGFSVTSTAVAGPYLSTISSPLALSCSTLTGGTSGTVVIRPATTLTGSNSITVSVGSLTGLGLSVTPAAGNVLNTTTQTAGLTYTVALTATAPCAGFNAGSPSFNFQAASGGTAVADVPITVNTTLSSGPYLNANPNSFSLTCSALTGPASTQITLTPVTPLTGNNTLTVSLGALTGLTVTPVAGSILNTTTQVAGIRYNVTLTAAAGCAGFTAGTLNFNFKVAAGAGTAVTDVPIAVTTTLSSGLVASPSAVTIACTFDGTNYSQLTSQTVSLTSSATGGLAYTVSAPAASTGVQMTTPSPLTATTTPVTFVVSPTPGADSTRSCGQFAVSTSKTTAIHLSSPGYPDTIVSVTLQIVKPTKLQITTAPSPAAMTYTKGSGTPAYVDANVTSTATSALFFSIDTTTLPTWLNVDSTTGTAGLTNATGKRIRFSSTTVADSLAPGIYSAAPVLNVAGYGAQSVPITLQVNNQTPKLTVDGVTRNFNWQVGSAVPTLYVTLTSSDSPISYSLASGGTLSPIVAQSEQNGLAYSFGTKIPVTFDPLVFASAMPGTVLTGTITITWGPAKSMIVVTFNANIQSPQATFTSISPASLPLASPGQTFTLGLTGTGFVVSTDPTLKTMVGVVVNGVLLADTNFAASILNTSNIALTITVPATADPNLRFGTGGNLSVGVCNPNGTSCSSPTGVQPLSIGVTPSIVALTSASTFIQSSTPTVAPFDMISIFGTNFCSTCTSSQVLPGVPDANLVYPTFVTPDPSTTTNPNQLTVSFYAHSSSQTLGALLGTAPVLFATNNQINVIVPSGVTAAAVASTSGQADIVVSFGNTNTTMSSSAVYPVNVAVADPGIFTVGSNGTGQGAILNTTYATVGQSNPAGMRKIAASDVVHIYMTGLGLPDTGADNANTGTGAGAVWRTDCVSTDSYLTSLGAQNGVTPPTTIDGAVIQSGLLNSYRLPPCVGTTNVITAKVGANAAGNPATVLYAGWVNDSIAGLYQVDLQLPQSLGAFTDSSNSGITNITDVTQLPITVYVNGATIHSQANVNIWVAPRLAMTGPGPNGLSCTVGTGITPTTLVAATAAGGTAPYIYTITSGLLPAGLSLVTTGNVGYIQGIPGANTAGSYLLTVTATDSSNTPVTGTWTFILNVAGGLVVNGPSSTITTTFGTPATTTLTSAGGTYPYTYAITLPASLPTGMQMNSPATSGVFATSALTPAGTYTVNVQSTDSTTTLQGIASFTVAVHLNMATTGAPLAVTNQTAQATVATVQTTGYSGTISYTLDAPSIAAGFGIDSSSGVITATQIQTAGSYSLVVRAQDSAPATGATGNATFTLTVPVTVN